jgi:isopentenyl phosphate kinase
MKNKKPLYIIKLGGSVVTHKHRSEVVVRKRLISDLAITIKKLFRTKDFDLIIVHGSGAAGHGLAKKYGLASGTKKNKQKWFASFLSNIANQKLNLAIAEILIKKGLRAVSMHTASIIMQDRTKIDGFNLENIRQALNQNCIPILYGEMVFDKKLGMSICSGDSIVPYLAKNLKAQKVFFASDIDGIFDKDPYVHKDAKLIEKIRFAKINKDVNLSGSHNIDVTGGLSGKIKKMESLAFSSVKQVEIFNGLNPENYKKAFLGKPFPHSKIIF